MNEETVVTGEAKTESAKAGLKGMIALFKGIKDPFHDFPVHPDSGITHGDFDELRRWICC